MDIIPFLSSKEKLYSQPNWLTKLTIFFLRDSSTYLVIGNNWETNKSFQLYTLIFFYLSEAIFLPVPVIFLTREAA